MSSFSHRAAGVAQLAFEALGLLRRRMTLRDFAGALRPMVVDCILRGHVDVRMFYGVHDDEYPELATPEGLEDDGIVLTAAIKAATRFASLGRERGGYLPSFATENAAHLAMCPRCCKTVCATIRTQHREQKSLKALLGYLGMDRDSARDRPSWARGNSRSN